MKRILILIALFSSAAAHADPWGTQTVTVFDNLNPEDFGLSVWSGYYDGYGSLGYFDSEQWTQDRAWAYWGGYEYGKFQLAVANYGIWVAPNTYEHGKDRLQANPWARMLGYDYDNDGQACAAGETDLGNDWCRRTLSGASTPFTFLPPLALVWYFPEGGNPIPGAPIVDAPAVDNVIVELISDNITIDYDPWNAANNIWPKATYIIPIQINTTSVSMGDAYDFDAADVDPATLSVGIDSATLVTVPQAGDLDGDGDTDYVFGFRMEETGLDCFDTSIMIAGRTFAGDPIVGHDVIVPNGCEETVDIDVDPWNESNEVRPDDSYIVPVGVLGMNTADGDAIDLDATQVDPASLRFGPAEAPHTGTPLTTDLDGDSNMDVIFGFQMQDSGIACGDTELEMTGSLYSTLPIEGTDSITTTDCQTNQCHP